MIVGIYYGPRMIFHGQNFDGQKFGIGAMISLMFKWLDDLF